MCSNHHPKGVGTTPWITFTHAIGMFTDYKPTVGFDEYFCNETARPRDDLATLLTPTSRLGCQIILSKALEGMQVTLPAYSRNYYVDGHVPEPH